MQGYVKLFPKRLLCSLAIQVVQELQKENANKLLINLLAFFFVIPLRFERKTHALEGRCSIQLSYGTILNCGAKVRFFMKTTNFRFKIFAVCIEIKVLSG